MTFHISWSEFKHACFWIVNLPCLASYGKRVINLYWVQLSNFTGKHMNFTQVKAKLPFPVNQCGQPTGNMVAFKFLFFVLNDILVPELSGLMTASSNHANALLKASPFVKVQKKITFVLYVFLIKYLCRYLCFSKKYNSCNIGINPSTKCKLTLSTQYYASLCGTCLCKPRFWTNKQTWKIETNKWECTINCSIF